MVSDAERDQVQKDLANRFNYHAPKEGQVERYADIRAMLREVAMAIKERTPTSREQSLALTKLEEVMFWANASIARNE